MLAYFYPSHHKVWLGFGSHVCNFSSVCCTLTAFQQWCITWLLIFGQHKSPSKSTTLNLSWQMAFSVGSRLNFDRWQELLHIVYASFCLLTNNLYAIGNNTSISPRCYDQGFCRTIWYILNVSSIEISETACYHDVRFYVTWDLRQSSYKLELYMWRLASLQRK